MRNTRRSKQHKQASNISADKNSSERKKETHIPYQYNLVNKRLKTWTTIKYEPTHT